MRIAKIFVLSMLFAAVAVSFSFPAQRAERMTGIGGGFFAGMSGLSGEMLFHFPKAKLNTDDLYMRFGLAYADSVNLTPGLLWRRALTLSVDGIYYFTDDAYFGAGLNVPLRVSDNDTGQMGGQLFLGSDLKLDLPGKIYGELGYSTLNVLGRKSFAGLYLTFGWRSEFDLIGAIVGK